MRISDWSSDVCSSDLGTAGTQLVAHGRAIRPWRRRVKHAYRNKAPDAGRDFGEAATPPACGRTAVGTLVKIGDRFGHRPVWDRRRKKMNKLLSAFLLVLATKIGRESGRERVCQYV